jgi:O-antigen/teichoic acid export membrane protein
MRNRLVSASLWNLAGTVVPLAASLVAVPLLLSRIGVDSFGFMSLCWAIIAYLGFLDLGLSRALSHAVSQRISSGAVQEISQLYRDSNLILGATGLLGGLALAGCAVWITHHVVQVPESLLPEATSALVMLAIAIPFTTLAGAPSGLLSAHERFGTLNKLRLVFGTLAALAPLGVSYVTTGLHWMMLSVSVVRALAYAFTWHAASDLIPKVHARPSGRGSPRRDLIRFSGWLTVTNLVGPVMTYFDKFIIGAWLNVASVAYYATPFMIVSKLNLIAAALESALFPRFSAIAAERRDARGLLSESLALNLATAIPGVALVALLAPEILTVWISGEFAAQSTTVMQIGAIGMLANAYAHVPYGLIQAYGRPDLTAKIHLLELPLYLAALAASLPHFGLAGAASVWAGRAVVDCIVLVVVAGRAAGTGWRVFMPSASVAAVLVIVLLVSVTAELSRWQRFLMLASILSPLAVLAVREALKRAGVVAKPTAEVRP